MKILFVVNPISGGVNKAPFMRKAFRLCLKYGIEVAMYKTTGQNDTEQLRKMLADEQPDKVVSVGGDGTTLFTGLALMGTPYAMGIVPLGSANGMAVELHVNPNPLEALRDIIMSQRVAGLDILQVNDRYHSMHIGDAGINARIVEAYEKDPNRGMLTYARYFIEELKTMSPFKVQVKTDREETTETVYMSALCNARKYGTGVPLNRESNPMDGLFEVVLVKRIDGPALIKAGLARVNENFLDYENGRVLQARQATLRFEKPVLWQLDGEVIGHFDEIKVAVLQGAIRLITHGDNPYLKA